MEPTLVTLVPHTHWDREWYQPFEAFRERLVAMMDGLIPLLDRGFPHFHLDGQTAMIDDYLAVRPEREGDIRRLARTGRISVGPWVTQMDEFLVSGESLLRNVENGMARARELGAEPPVGHLPDQFGHVGQMPQILSRAGIDRAVLWRGVPSSIDRTSFWWEAPDGSRVLAEYLAFGYGLGGSMHRATEPQELAEQLRNAVGLLTPLSPGRRVLVMVGGDHHGPDTTLPERLLLTAPLTPDIEAKVGSLADHLVDPPPPDIPVWRGELRSAHRAHLLPGVYSTRAHQKRDRGRLEALIERYAEPLAALVPGCEWPQKELDRIWQLMLWNGAHDSVCGCSIDQVARDVETRYEEARVVAEAIVTHALAVLGAHTGDAGAIRFNPSPFERDGIPGLGWRIDRHDVTPVEVPVSVTVEGEWVVADDVGIRLVDQPDVGDLYTFCPDRAGRRLSPETLTVQDQVVTATFGRADLVVRLRVSRREDDRFLRVDGVVHNGRPDHRLRLHVSLPGLADRVVAGAPFELVHRGLVSEGGTETPSPTWPARHVLMAGGVGVLAEGVVEYEVVGGRELAVTLLRCVGTISRPHVATRNWAAGPDIATPDAQMIGETAFAVGILPGATRQDLLSEWERFALPVRSGPARGGGPIAATGSLLEVRGAELSNVRRRDGGVLVTLWNPDGRTWPAVVAGMRVDLGPGAIVSVSAER